MPYRLKQETKDAINSEKNNLLAASVADALGIKVTSLRSALARNVNGLLNLPVLKVISDFTGLNPEDLYEEYAESEKEFEEQNS